MWHLEHSKEIPQKVVHDKFLIFTVNLSGVYRYILMIQNYQLHHHKEDKSSLIHLLQGSGENSVKDTDQPKVSMCIEVPQEACLSSI